MREKFKKNSLFGEFGSQFDIRTFELRLFWFEIRRKVLNFHSFQGNKKETMPLPAALLARLAKRGLVQANKGEETCSNSTLSAEFVNSNVNRLKLNF